MSPLRLTLGIVCLSIGVAAPPDGSAVYGVRCAMCHEQKSDRMPARQDLAKLTPEEVVKALTTGAMKAQGSALSDEDKRAVASYVTGKEFGHVATIAEASNNCADDGGAIDLKSPGWNGWGNGAEQPHYQPQPGLTAADVPKLQLKFAFGYTGNITYGQPSVIGNRLYVTSAAGKVTALNAKSGCTYWSFDAGSGVRTAVSVGPMPKGAYAAYFGDEKTYVHAVDARTGKTIWKTQLDEHPLARIAGSPVLYKNRIYVPVSSWEEGAGMNPKYECCKFRGSINALDATTGKLLWKTYTITDPPKPFKVNSAETQMYGPAGAAVWSSPTLDTKRKVLYVATGNSYTDVETTTANAVLAVDMETGSIKWANQVTPKDNYLVGCMKPGFGNCPSPVGPDVDLGATPIIRTLANGKQVVLAGQKSGILYALDPDQRGKILWQKKLGAGSPLGGIEWGFAADASQVYVAIADAVAPPDQAKPGLTALKISTGEDVWHAPSPKPECAWGKSRCAGGQSQAVTAMPGAVFSGGLDGHLRAYSTTDGSVLWDFDTGTAFETVNGVRANGGSLDAGGPTIANGMLYVNSGYGRFAGHSGNVLLAFSVGGK